MSIDNRGKRGRNIGPRMNDDIRLSECRLISDDGEQFGIVSLTEARRIAGDRGLDLVEVSPNAKPPVVKVIDYGKHKYETQKSANASKRKQLTTALKEIQFRPNIEAHDLETKLKRASKFLLSGNKVKLVMQFRGREMAHRDVGFQKFLGIIENVRELGAIIESEPRMMGNRIISMVAPDKKIIKEAAARVKLRAQQKDQEKEEVKHHKMEKRSGAHPTE
ncbi:MAG: translation initiation factor IF-3 [Bacteriovoracaceae bacterium]|nr:translation initiation factor IF-3 [Bacteriovoracaceae bacterium]